MHAIKDAQRELARMVKFQKLLLAVVGHDLRTPLSAILTGRRFSRRAHLLRCVD
ncbi:hypothetical protein AKJ09_07336 [Labilithrix luteola]|uniref:Signal transduction histidine kinase dimerisation/phosphoacceptor domain-containing protein n=1 Tax=Labilithrix luteola TaxID=1391654 RepID=A0A0K1Q4L1_9BACT|nr:hypothetical protein AKJ09_07336 [Labilithrix luteola]